MRLRWALLILGAAYLVMWLAVPKPSFWVLDNGFKYQGIRAFAENGSILIPYAGANFDPAGRYRPIIAPFGLMRNSQQAPVFPPAFIVIGGGLRRWLGDWAPYALPLLGGWLTLLAVVWLWARLDTQRHGWRAVLLAGLGTPLLFYSLTLWEHTLSCAGVTAGLALLAPGREKSPRVWWEPVLAGGLLAVAGGFRTEVYPLALVAMVLWPLSGRGLAHWLWFIAGFAVVVGVIAAVNYWQTGTAMPLHVVSNLRIMSRMDLAEVFESRLRNLHVLLTMGFKEVGLSLLLLAPLLLAVILRPRRRDFGVWAAVAVVVALVETFYLSRGFAATDRAAWTANSGGMFWVSPILALAILPPTGRLEGVWGMIWAGCWVGIGLVALALPEAAGVHWGPRFIVAFLPVLAVVAVYRAVRWWKHWPATRLFLVTLGAVSVFNQLQAAELAISTQKTNAALNRWALESPLTSLTNVWFLPGDCSLASQDTAWFVTESGEAVHRVVSELRQRKVYRFNFYEYPPFMNQERWWEYGAEVTRTEHFTRTPQPLRRTVLRVIF